MAGGPRRRVIRKDSGLVDTSKPSVRHEMIDNLSRIYENVPQADRDQYRPWYEKVHEATQKGVRNRGLSVEQGAGMVAAVSPNMDWERNNIDAFQELSSLRQRDWNTINQSARSPGKRSPEARSLLQGMGISSAPDTGLVKAHRIMQGESIDDVLPRRTAPKTNAFAHNIAVPDRAGMVTIDGRAHDVAANRMQPWESGRGINSAALKTGKPTRYEHFEQAYSAVGQDAGELPHNLQAILWEHGRRIERSGTTKAGNPRKVGVRRVGQPYLET